MKKNLSIILLILLLIAPLFASDNSSIPKSSSQLILVITDSLTATRGSLYCYEKESSSGAWIPRDKPVDISLGRSGLGKGRGLHDTLSLKNMPSKREGDGRSPAGIFELSAVFGYLPENQMNHLTLPYIHVTEMIECIDDAESHFYNQIVSRQAIDSKIDWQSSEKMSRAGIYYEQGVVVDHNTDPVRKGAGSCIFLHNWAEPWETTAGCTVMKPNDLKKIINWLDENKNPVLVQLTQQLYDKLIEEWNLPDIY